MKWLSAILLLSGSALASASIWAQSNSTQVQQPDRAYGYMLGDVITQIVSLDQDQPVSSLNNLPAEQRVGQWLYRKATTTDTKSNTLTLSYQIINSPLQRITIELPAIELNSANAVPFKVDTWPISIGPLTPVELSGEGDLIALQPDAAAASADTQTSRKSVALSMIALVAILLMWLAWWFARNHSDARKLPYAKAYRQAKNRSNKDSQDDEALWQHLHRAFNESAQRTIHIGTQEYLFARSPWLSALKPRINNFYSASNKRFFHPDALHESFPLVELIEDLYRLEKQETIDAPPGKHSVHQ